MDNLSDSSCESSPHCSQCWKLCFLLQSDVENRRLCILPDCGRGCREACRLHMLQPSPAPVFTPLHEDTLQTTASGVSWPASQGPVVYLVLPSGLQTLDCHARVSVGESPRVLAVDWRGVVRVLGPPQDSPLTRVRTIIRSLGLAADPSYRRLADQNTSNSIPLTDSDPAVGRWALREEALVTQSALVLATVSWDQQQQQLTDQLSYLITWEAEGGIVRGNLLTNSTRVTLSLWPETVYKVQVSTLEPVSTSEALLVDTRLAPPAQPLGHPRGQPRLVGAAVVLLMLVTLVLTWRGHHHLALPHSKLVDEEVGTPNLYRVFPPVVRLIGERKKSSPEMFFSTDNLLQNN